MPDWRFTAQEFEILWAAYGRDRLPYPLRFRPLVNDFEVLRQQREAAVAALLAKYTDDLPRALQVLLEPDVRVEIKGFTGPDLAEVIRFHGAIRGSEGAALRQFPGPSEDIGADVLVSYGDPAHVAHQAVAALPPRGPGTRPPLEIRREQVTAERNRPITTPGNVVDQLNTIFKRQRLGLGEVTVLASPAFDSRPTPGRGFWWMDYEDGRYYVKTGDPIIAKPLDPTRMTAEIHRLTTLTQRYHTEDREHDEYLRTRR
ncbi:ESX secretion-associated protein EspG [Nocardia sp. CDC159]|uniref:ESX secretion-associated protein EspG n=1 Tax=Nocardia pulmonis TaxID=2951408 RepID=A0A9X2E913_9NOCA|nr:MULTISPECIES: ESX secretion-associated protein EspG [Nocardia]MCM6773941.1 ESX secretion-associated protein EspG [Nocardia pulmonis]MCM6786828.1 ESX secretion-associated protein EspG [Nocardia sp. CDC159]